jgi:hypothetical protein
MATVQEMTAEQLLKDFSEDSEPSTEHGHNVRTEILRRMSRKAEPKEFPLTTAWYTIMRDELMAVAPKLSGQIALLAMAELRCAEKMLFTISGQHNPFAEPAAQPSAADPQRWRDVKVELPSPEALAKAITSGTWEKIPESGKLAAKNSARGILEAISHLMQPLPAAPTSNVGLDKPTDIG